MIRLARAAPRDLTGPWALFLDSLASGRKSEPVLESWGRDGIDGGYRSVAFQFTAFSEYTLLRSVL